MRRLYIVTVLGLLVQAVLKVQVSVELVAEATVLLLVLVGPSVEARLGAEGGSGDHWWTTRGGAGRWRKAWNRLRRLLMRARDTGCQGSIWPLRRPLEAALNDDICLFVALQVVLVPMCYRGPHPHWGHWQTWITSGSAAIRRLARAARYPAAADHVIALVHWLDRHNQVVAVGDHHIRYLIQGLPSHFNAVHLQHLIINREQPCALRQPSRHHPGYEDAWDFLQPMWCHTNAGSISDVKTQRLVWAVAIQPDTTVRFRQDVHINNGGDGPEVLGHADADVWPFAVDVVVAQCNHCFLPACYSVGAKVSIVDLFCEEIRGDRKQRA